MTHEFSRRDLALLIPALTAAGASAQQQAAPLPTMTSQVYASKDIPYAGDENKKGHRLFFQQTHAGFKIEAHETILGPGVQTHEPHQHEHEEMILVVAGTLEANVEGAKLTAPEGSVLVFGSNKVHNARNVGATPCRYYVVELRGNDG